MLTRSTSSRRRRASRSAASSPAQVSRPPGTRSAATSPGRRASIAVSPIDGNRSGGLGLPEINRSPRHSIIPDIALMETKDDKGDFDDVLDKRTPRHSLIPDSALSPRNSLVPDGQRSPRHSLVPNDLRSPRNSLVPDSVLSPRNSLTPEQYNRSPRNSLVPDPCRSPRHSLTPESNTYGSRLNIAEYSRSPRNSLLPDGTRSPRQGATPMDSKPWSSDDGGPVGRSPRHSIAPGDSTRSPRGSIAPEPFSYRTSPRGSIAGGSVAGDYAVEQRTPRGSIGPENGYDPNRSPRGSIAARNNLANDMRSSRGSLTLTFQEPPVNERRSSADNPSNSRGRSSSPSYRSSSRGNVNTGYGTNSGFESSGSRRASSSVSQVSGDEQRRLCGDQKYSREMGQGGLSLSLTLTTYGSVAYQLKDANLEATGTCDFVFKALRIVNKTVVVTILLGCLSIVPLIMLIMGVQFLRDCPKEPNIPIYMVVGGTVGSVKMGLCLWDQLHTRHVEPSASNNSSLASRFASIALTIVLIGWFGLGNYWILHIKYPDYAPTWYEPNKWCHRTLYVFALVHLCIVYSLFGVLIVLVIVLALCQIFGCQWLGPARYK